MTKRTPEEKNWAETLEAQLAEERAEVGRLYTELAAERAKPNWLDCPVETVLEEAASELEKEYPTGWATSEYSAIRRTAPRIAEAFARHLTAAPPKGDVNMGKPTEKIIRPYHNESRLPEPIPPRERKTYAGDVSLPPLDVEKVAKEIANELCSNALVTFGCGKATLSIITKHLSALSGRDAEVERLEEQLAEMKADLERYVNNVTTAEEKALSAIESALEGIGSPDKSLAERIAAMRAAVQKHHGQKADDRCIGDDTELYAAFGLPPADHHVGDKEAMLAACKRFIENRCQGGKWTSYADLEKDRDQQAAELASTKRDRDQWKAAVPSQCPITDLPFFMLIYGTNGEGPLPTYGGPYDSYTIPVLDGGDKSDRQLMRQRYDHDRGCWLGDEWEAIGLYLMREEEDLIPLWHQEDELEELAKLRTGHTIYPEDVYGRPREEIKAPEGYELGEFRPPAEDDTDFLEPTGCSCNHPRLILRKIEPPKQRLITYRLLGRPPKKGEKYCNGGAVQVLIAAHDYPENSGAEAVELVSGPEVLPKPPDRLS